MEILVDRCRLGDLSLPVLQLRCRRKFVADQQMGHLKERGPLSQLLNRIAPIVKEARPSVQEGDGAIGARGGAKGRVVEPDPGQQRTPGLGRHGAIDERDFDCSASPVVGDRYAVGHGAVSPSTCRSAIRTVTPNALRSVRGSSSTSESLMWFLTVSAEGGRIARDRSKKS